MQCASSLSDKAATTVKLLLAILLPTSAHAQPMAVQKKKKSACTNILNVTFEREIVMAINIII
jgi:hypothetical protein